MWIATNEFLRFHKCTILRWLKTKITSYFSKGLINKKLLIGYSAVQECDARNDATKNDGRNKKNQQTSFFIIFQKENVY